MKATITVDMDNQAFEGDVGVELARILRDAADKVENTSGAVWALWDSNGNTVGKLEVTP